MTEQLVVNGLGQARASVVAGHLRWIHGMLDALRLPAEPRDAIREGLRAVRERAADPELRVAVFGEASSGKSTLLNAFMRRRLLPSSAQVTTHTTTVLRYGDGAEGLLVRTADDVELTWPSGAFARWTGQGHVSGPADLADALERVLTTELAERIRSLEVLSPVPLLADGTAVLDTPGFSVSNRGHRELAVAAARQADLALVVVPAVAAMSMTLVDFLTGPLQDHHDRCAFVLTKADLLDDGERGEVVEGVANRLRDLGISDPVLLPCAPERALKEITGGPEGHRPGAEHLPRFLAVEARIAGLAAERRQSAIEATVLGLLSQLLSAVEESAEAQRAALSRTERGLAALSLPDFPAFLDAWAGRTLDRAGYELADGTGDRPASRAELDTKVVAAVAGDRIGKMAETTGDVSRIVRLHLRQEAEGAVQAALDQAGELLISGAEELACEFAAQYSALAGLVGEVRDVPLAAPPVHGTGLPAPDLSGVDETLTAIGAQLTASDNWRTGGGAMAGALAGSLIAGPGFGTVIGGAIGAIIGKRSPDAARAQFLERVRPIIADAHDEIGTLVSESVTRVRAGVADGVAALREQYDDEWGGEIARLTAANGRQRAELAAGIAAAEKAATDARRRREEVTALRGVATRIVPDPEE